jgi:hypothetical protein
MSEDNVIIAGGIYMAGLSGAICALHFCWDALQQAGLVVPVLLGACSLAAVAPWVYLLYSERSR